MPPAEYLIPTIVILLSAVVCLWLAQRLRLASVFGYLVAGMIIGPAALGLVTDIEATRPLAELGVVFLLFTVGLELPIERIRVMRPAMFGLGAAQIALTAALVVLVAVLAGVALDSALVIGGALALSSTAIVLQLLTERRDLTSRSGRSAFAVLLTQDLAVGPLLVVVIALGQETGSLGMGLAVAALKAAAALAIILVVGRLVLRPLFRPVAATRNPELFAALTLLVILCTGLATQFAGLSMAFGAFLAGMLLAETTYRHQVAAVILPFRGLLLGLFFITVGMAVNLAPAVRDPGLIVAMVAGLLIGKAVVLGGLCLLFRLPASQSIYLSLLLCQGGEFAFVLLGAGADAGVLSQPLAQEIVLVVIISMILTPVLAIAGRKAFDRLERSKSTGVDQIASDPITLSNHVVITGYGRAGGAIAAHLRIEKVPFVAVDMDPDRVAAARKEGLPVYFGDATRPEVLATLGVDRARAVIVALDDTKMALQIVALLRYVFPELKIFARAHDEAHGEELRTAGADGVVPEISETAMKLAGSVLQGDA